MFQLYGIRLQRKWNQNCNNEYWMASIDQVKLYFVAHDSSFHRDNIVAPPIFAFFDSFLFPKKRWCWFNLFYLFLLNPCATFFSCYLFIFCRDIFILFIFCMNNIFYAMNKEKKNELCIHFWKKSEAFGDSRIEGITDSDAPGCRGCESSGKRIIFPEVFFRENDSGKIQKQNILNIIFDVFVLGSWNIVFFFDWKIKNSERGRKKNLKSERYLFKLFFKKE